MQNKKQIILTILAIVLCVFAACFLAYEIIQIANYKSVTTYVPSVNTEGLCSYISVPEEMLPEQVKPTPTPEPTPIPEPTPEPVVETVVVEEPVAEPEPEPPQTDISYASSDVIELAKMLYGEGRGCSTYNQMQAVWCVLNRVDSPQYPNSVTAVLSQPGQFHGYSPYFPVWDELVAIAQDVYDRWLLEKQGVAVERELEPGYLYFTGNGYENVFY